MNNLIAQDQQKLMSLMQLCHKEAGHLHYSWQQVFLNGNPPSDQWLRSLSANASDSVQLEAFASRFSRLQDTLGQKVLRTLLTCLAEPHGSQIENLNKGENLGIIENTEAWLKVRTIRNFLVHEHIEDLNSMKEALELANQFTDTLFRTYNLFRETAINILKIPETDIPKLAFL